MMKYQLARIFIKSKEGFTLSKATRTQKRLNNLGAKNPKCAICSEENPFALQNITICRDCFNRRLEEHHLAGRHTGPSIFIPQNLHAELTDKQLDWPEGLLNKNRTWRQEYLDLLCGVADILKVYAHKIPENEDGLKGFSLTCRQIVFNLAGTLELQALAFLDREERRLAWETAKYLRKAADQ
jgi:hypothetical protein